MTVRGDKSFRLDVTAVEMEGLYAKSSGKLEVTRLTDVKTWRERGERKRRKSLK